MQTIQHDRLAMDNAFEGGGGDIWRNCLRWMQKMRHDTKTSQDIRFWGEDLKPDC